MSDSAHLSRTDFKVTTYMPGGIKRLFSLQKYSQKVISCDRKCGFFLPTFTLCMREREERTLALFTPECHPATTLISV